MNKELRNTLAPYQIGQAETYFACYVNESDLENVQPEAPEWAICSTPSKWTPENWKWFLQASGKITINTPESIL